MRRSFRSQVQSAPDIGDSDATQQTLDAASGSSPPFLPTLRTGNPHRLGAQAHDVQRPRFVA